MNNAVTVIGTQRAVEVYGDRSLTAADVQAQINLMQDVMRSTMIEGTHYGTIPGTKSKSLYKPGAEKLMATFRLACDPLVEDLSHDGEIHYRLKVEVRSSSGALLGAGVGECSSQEDKYAWRAAVCKEEWDATPENRRRVKFSKYNGKVEQKQQVRTNPADVANTILKMAKKRGLVDAILTVTAASDIFTQDIEDLPEEIQAEIVEQDRTTKPSSTREGLRMQDFPPDRQKEIGAWARDILAACIADDIPLATKHWVDCDLPQEEKAAVFFELDSTQRAAIKNEVKQAKAPPA